MKKKIVTVTAAVAAVAMLAGCGIISTLLGANSSAFLAKREQALQKTGVAVRTFRFVPGIGDVRAVRSGDLWQFYGTNGADGGRYMEPFTEAVFEDARPAAQTDVKGELRYVAPAKYDGKWGILDVRASKDEPRWVIEPRFEEAKPVVDGLAAVRENGLYGFIDMTGEYRIKPKYMSAKYFIYGFAPVQTQDGIWRYVDVNGAESGSFDEAEPFGDAYAAAVKSEGKWGYIGMDFQWITEPQYEDAWEADADSKAWVLRDGQWIRISLRDSGK